MNLDNLNKWLTLLANFGVLAGIIFLSLEISQSNRIADRDGRIESVNQAFELQRIFIENPDFSELMVKLSDTNAELTPLEVFQAESFAAQLILRAATLQINYENDFISGQALERQIAGIIQNIRRIPGIAPFLANSMAGQDIGVRGVNPITDAIWEELDRVK